MNGSELQQAISQYWGYTSFRQLQREAMEAVLGGRDSIVVLPTGGGKSLCFQAPAVVRPGTAVIVSPLISLMKDQVDTLVGNGVPAALFNSSLSSTEKADVVAGLRLAAAGLAPDRGQGVVDGAPTGAAGVGR